MWGAKASIRWHAPSCHNLTCQARIDKPRWEGLAKRFTDSRKLVATVPVEMFNGDQLVAEATFTYWMQDLAGMKRNAFDLGWIDLLYEHKTKSTAKLIAGLRALEQERPVAERRFDDPYTFMLAGRQGIYPGPALRHGHAAAATSGGGPDPAPGSECHGVRAGKGRLQCGQYRRRL